MSYAQAAAQGANQSRKDARAPPPPTIEKEEDVSTSSLVDVDSPHVSTVPSDFGSQGVKTTTQAERIEREQEAKAQQQQQQGQGQGHQQGHRQGDIKGKAREEKDQVKEKAKAATRKAQDKAADGCDKLNRNKSNPVVVSNAVLLTVLGAGLAYGAYQKQVRGALTWELIAKWTGGIGAVGVFDYFNSLFNAALKQSTAVRRDLESFADAQGGSPAALQGQLSASLASFSRTIDDYSALSKKELIASKQEKAFDRVKNFRSELADYRQQFERLRGEKEETQHAINRHELLGRRPHQASTPENPYAQSNLPIQPSPFSNPHRRQHSTATANGSGLGFGTGPSEYNRENHALREQSFLSNTNTQLDEFIDRGRAVLGDLGQQRDILKGTQRRLYSVANTMGISGDTIRKVERRAKQDKWIFWVGVVIFFGACWAILHFLR
ncbi:protein transport protein bos1 [Myotisia sp. PD_48]|nr:protein transport protein bos1 [Myotisia sp. PD_48]